jgi:hypothetical protein
MAKRAKNRATARRSAKTVDPKTLADLVPDAKNARRHTERNLAMIDESLATVGACRSVVIDEGGRLLAGNATARQALARGLKLKVVDTDADTIVAVRRSGLTEDQKTTLALYDNRAAELAEWDAEAIRALFADGLSPAPFFDPATLAAVLGEVEPFEAPPEDGGPVRGTGQCGVIVICDNEAAQERTYQALVDAGYTCRVVNT